MPLSYNDVRKLILQTLEERPEGTKVQVPNQQNYELALLDYVQQLQTTMATSIVGIADEDTEPIEPPTARISYLSQVGVNSTIRFNNFVDAQLNPISVTTDESHVAFVTLFWNTNYWQYQAVMIPIISSSGGTTDYNNLENIPTINGVKVKGDLTGENLKLVDKSVYDAFVIYVNNILNEQYSKIASFTASPSVVEKGIGAQSVKLSWRTTFNDQSITPDSLSVKKSTSETPLTTDKTLTTITDSASADTTYTLEAVIKGVIKTATASARFYYPQFAGASANESLASADVLALGNKVVAASVARTVTMQVAQGEYFWFAVPENFSITSIKMGGFDVSLNDVATVAVDGRGNYKCYRSAKPQSAGSYTFEIK